MKLDSWYKSLVESSNFIPPEEVWEGIQDELDIDLVWTRIDQSLVYQRKKNWIAAFAVAASLFLVAAVGGILYYMSINQAYENPIIAEQQVQNAPLNNSTQEQQQTLNDEPSIDEPSFEMELDKARGVSLEIVTVNYTEEKVQTEDIFNQTYLVIKPIQTSVFPSRILMEEIPKIAVNNPNPISPKGESFKVNSLYAGLTGQLANTWMLSNKTFQAFKSDELTATNATFGKNLGVTVGADITQKIGVKSEFMWISQNKQDYNEYINGKYVSNSLEINYYTLTLQAKYLFREKLRSHYILFGSYFGIMQSATQSISGVSSEISSDYRNLDYGLILGYELPIHLGSGLKFSPGVSMKYGLVNIFMGNETIPHYLNRTQNASFNFSFTLSYNLF